MANVETHTESTNGKDANGFHGGADLGRSISVQLTPEQFEELYLQPARVSRAAAENIRRFGNPTPIGILGFVLTFTPTSTCLMRFGESSSASFPALVPIFIFCGGLMLFMAGLLEFVLGASFSALAFTSFGAFWFTLGLLNQPLQGFAQAAGGGTSGEFGDAVGAFFVCFGVYCIVMTICCTRVNVAFFMVFLSVSIAAIVIGSAYFILPSDATYALLLLRVGGAFGFICSVSGWYIFASLMLAIAEMPFGLPMGDLSQRFKRKDKYSA